MTPLPNVREKIVIERSFNNYRDSAGGYYLGNEHVTAELARQNTESNPEAIAVPVRIECVEGQMDE
ncbi:MAG TPA: hypothetical protein VHD36_22285 [Pirellulales bacterium]|nr:hypothetical protein [Pirellulales bacterium]